MKHYYISTLLVLLILNNLYADIHTHKKCRKKIDFNHESQLDSFNIKNLSTENIKENNKREETTSTKSNTSNSFIESKKFGKIHEKEEQKGPGPISSNVDKQNLLKSENLYANNMPLDNEESFYKITPNQIDKEINSKLFNDQILDEKVKDINEVKDLNTLHNEKIILSNKTPQRDYVIIQNENSFYSSNNDKIDMNIDKIPINTKIFDKNSEKSLVLENNIKAKEPKIRTNFNINVKKDDLRIDNSKNLKININEILENNKSFRENNLEKLPVDTGKSSKETGNEDLKKNYKKSINPNSKPQIIINILTCDLSKSNLTINFEPNLLYEKGIKNKNITISFDNSMNSKLEDKNKGSFKDSKNSLTSTNSRVERYKNSMQKNKVLITEKEKNQAYLVPSQTQNMKILSNPSIYSESAKINSKMLDGIENKMIFSDMNHSLREKPIKTSTKQPYKSTSHVNGFRTKAQNEVVFNENQNNNLINLKINSITDIIDKKPGFNFNENERLTKSSKVDLNATAGKEIRNTNCNEDKCESNIYDIGILPSKTNNIESPSFRSINKQPSFIASSIHSSLSNSKEDINSSYLVGKGGFLLSSSTLISSKPSTLWSHKSPLKSKKRGFKSKENFTKSQDFRSLKTGFSSNRTIQAIQSINSKSELHDNKSLLSLNEDSNQIKSRKYFENRNLVSNSNDKYTEVPTSTYSQDNDLANLSDQTLKVFGNSVLDHQKNIYSVEETRKEEKVTSKKNSHFLASKMNMGYSYKTE